MLLLVVIAFIVLVALQPADWRVTRSAAMAAPPAAVFEQLNDFHKWEKWSPWIERDPNTKGTYEGPDAGVGSKFSWTERRAGQRRNDDHREPAERATCGWTCISSSRWTDLADTEFTIKPDGEKSAVTWTMAGKNGFIEKAFCMFMNMDKMVGGDFEKGLGEYQEDCGGHARRIGLPTFLQLRNVVTIC